MKYHTYAIGIEDGDEQPRGAHAPSPVLAPVLPLLWSCYRACYSPVLFSRNAEFMGIYGRATIKFPVLYRDKALETLEMQTAVAFSQIGESKKAIDLLPLDAKTNPKIHPLWRL